MTLANGTEEGFLSVACRENFLVIRVGFQNGIDVLDVQGNVIHTVECEYMSDTSGLAVWEDSILVISYHGELLWLSPV